MQEICLKHKEVPANDNFQELYNNFYNLYKNQKYFDIVRLYKMFLCSTKYKEHCFVDFNMVVDITIYASLACFNLNEYEDAKRYLTDFEEIYLAFKHKYCFLMEKLRKKNFKTIAEPESKLIVNYMNETLRDFNQNNKVRFYNNIGYAYYKCGLYNEAINCYKRTLSILPNNIQLIVGYHQAVYYNNTPHGLTEIDRIRIINDINKIKKEESNYDSYLALGKLYYFLGDFPRALNYINIAISTIKEDENKYNKEISAYDWISRIAYKQKQYSTASIFYEKIIDALINDNSFNINNHEEIHPKPELYKMLNFLNETKQLIADEETSKLNKSIWAGIIITSFFGLIECLESYKYSPTYCIFIFVIIFVLSCIIIRCNIKFFDFLKKYIPTFYGWVAKLFHRIS